jgi:hypothetical protein
MMPDEVVPVQVVQTSADIPDMDMDQWWWQFSDDHQVVQYASNQFSCTCGSWAGDTYDCQHISIIKRLVENGS